MNSKIYFSQNTYDKWHNDFESCDVIYIHAMAGYGKTLQATEFAKMYFSHYFLLSVTESDLLLKLERQIKLAEKLSENSLIIIDNLHCLNDEEDKKKLLYFLQTASNNVKFILLSRLQLPNFLVGMRLTGKLTVKNNNSLRLNFEQVTEIIKDYPTFAEMSEVDIKKRANACMEFSSGYPISVIAFIQRLSENNYNLNTVVTFATKDLCDFFEYDFEYIREEDEIKLLKLAVFDAFTIEMAGKVLGEKHLGFVEYVEKNYAFLQKIDKDTYEFESNFYKFLRERFLRTKLFDTFACLEIAAEYHMKKRNFEAALSCYSITKNYDRIVRIVVYLSENADGCKFAAISDRYAKQIPEGYYKNNPQLLGAKSMIAAYCLRKEESYQYLAELKNLSKEDKTALAVYVRTVIASPVGSPDKLKDNLLQFSEYVIKNGIKVDNIMPTGNMPSLLNGGLDLLAWANYNTLSFAMIKKAAQAVIGFEFVGGYDLAIGELEYERNKLNASLSNLAKGLNTATNEGSIRVRYAAIAMMAKVFCADNNVEKAMEIMQIFREKAELANFYELMPNISATLVSLALLKNDIEYCSDWLEKKSPNEFLTFYITLRYELYVKATVYIAMGKYLDALHIMNLLENYAEICDRKYFLIKINLMKSIIFFRQNEDWQKCFLSAVKLASTYKLVRIIADEGSAIVQMLEKINWKKQNIPFEYINSVQEEAMKMAKYYPDYMKISGRNVKLTKKEKEILILLSQGYTNARMSEKLEINLGTVKFHISNIMRKFDVGSRTAVVKIAHDEGII